MHRPENLRASAHIKKPIKEEAEKINSGFHRTNNKNGY